MLVKKALSPWMRRAAAALAVLSVGAPAADQAAASGPPPVTARLHCRFDTQAPGPGQTIDRRFQEVRLFGSCNRRVQPVPLMFVDGVQLSADPTTVASPFRFVGASSLTNLSAGPHRFEVTVEPEDPSVAPFARTWIFFAR